MYAIWVHDAWRRIFSQPTINGMRGASPAGDEQVSGPCVAQPIVRRLQQRAIGAVFACASLVHHWYVPGI